MSKIELILKSPPMVTLEAEVISPDQLVDMTHDQIRSATVYHGNRAKRLDDFFDVTGQRSDQLILRGNLQRVRHIGRAMSRGSITIDGDVGMHLGAYMSGGKIEVHGNAGDWVGGEMTGGSIHIRGMAGQQVGAAYRGSLLGMRGGTIIVDRDAGIEVGMRMQRGLIVIGGRARDFVGLQMKGGTIVLCAGAEIRTGAWMQRGTIISLADLTLMPTFADSGSFNPTFMNVFARRMMNLGITIPYHASEGTYQRYTGDQGVPGKGEILIWKPRANATT